MNQQHSFNLVVHYEDQDLEAWSFTLSRTDYGTAARLALLRDLLTYAHTMPKSDARVIRIFFGDITTAELLGYEDYDSIPFAIETSFNEKTTTHLTCARDYILRKSTDGVLRYETDRTTCYLYPETAD